MEREIGEVELLRLADLNYAQFWCDSTNWMEGSEIVWETDTLLINSPVDFPGCNVAFNMALGSVEGPEAVVARVKAWYRQRGRRGLSLILRQHEDGALVQYCMEKKYFRLEGQKGMVLDAPVKSGPAPAGAELKWVSDAAGLKDYSNIVTQTFGDLAFPVNISEAYFADSRRVLNPYSWMAVVRFEGRPVSAAMMMLSHGIAGVYWVGTLKEKRGKGLAEYCTREVSNAAFELGASKVILQASKYGEPVYRRMGYREFTDYPWFIFSSK